MKVIEIEHLTKDYGKQRGVFDLSFSIGQGEVFGFLGPNGAGKTTTIRHLLGFLRPEQGRLAIGGLDCWKHAAQIQKNLGYIPGETAFFDEMTGEEFLHFLADFRGQRNFTRANELMDRFELNAKSRLKRMSKGTKQKIAIVSAFMHQPEVLILDEPTSGLDPLMQNRFVELILEEKQKGHTILMSSHMFEEVERTCDRVGIIREGHLVAVDQVEALKATRHARYTITFSSEQQASAFAQEALAIDSVSGCQAVVSVTGDLNALIAALARYDVRTLETNAQSLEEVFLHYYGGEQE